MARFAPAGSSTSIRLLRAEPDHGFVLGQDLADQGFLAACAGIIDQLLQQRLSEAAALQVAAHEDDKFCALSPSG